MRIVDVVCPCCGEPGTVELEDVEEDDEFVQDCAVCCRPWTVRVRGGQVTVTPEGE